MKNQIYYGDNLDVLRNHIADESVDLCYIDPPFNSDRNYNQIYSNIGKEDAAQARAFVDTWTWDSAAELGLHEVFINKNGVMTAQSIDLITGLQQILGKSPLLAYTIAMTLRIAEIRRVLKSTGSLYLHCDQTASHYLKLVCDAIFCPGGGVFLNEIIWKRAVIVKNNFGQGSGRLDVNTDSIFFYCKKNGKNKFAHLFKSYSPEYLSKFYKYTDEDGRQYRLISMIGPGGAAKGNPFYEVLGVSRFWRYSKEKMQNLLDGNQVVQTKKGNVPLRKRYLDEGQGVVIQSLWEDIPALQGSSKEYLGYPTQKPVALLERIIAMSSNEGDVVLDAFCGCGTTIAAAEKMGRKWIGIDITYQSISLILKRMEETFVKSFNETALDKESATQIAKIQILGVPKDFDSAKALAERQDDKTRKEFEKWIVLTYSQNKAIINEQKGGDGGVDGVVFVPDRNEKGKVINRKCLFSVKSSKVLTPSMINELNGVIEKEGAACGVFLSLYPAKNLVKAAKDFGMYHNNLINKNFPKIQIVCVDDIFNGAIMDLPNVVSVVKTASPKIREQKELF